MKPGSKSTRMGAGAHAARVCGGLAKCDGVLDEQGRWTPTVFLRPDQLWMRDRVAERGVAVVELPPEVRRPG